MGRDDLADILNRHAKHTLVNTEEHAAGDCQRQRQTDREAGDLSASRVDFDRPVEADDLGADDIHADAAAGDVGNLGGGAEAGLPDQLVEFAFGQGFGSRLREQAAFHGRLPHPLTVDAAAIVFDGDKHVVAAMGGGQPDRGHLRLARCGPGCGRLDPVVDRVANEMIERVADLIDHPTAAGAS